MAKCAIISIGSELVRGKIVDTNSAHIGATLSRLGFTTVAVYQVADDIPSIVAALLHAAAQAEIVITTGGLGPTLDDKTREALAEATNSQLTLREDSLNKLEQLLARRQRPLNEQNKRQAYFPHGAEVIVNPEGTADAFALRIPQNGGSFATVFCLPGVPSEMKSLLAQELAPRLSASFPQLQATPELSFRCFGLAESQIAERIEALSLPRQITVSYRPQFPEVLLQLAGDHQLLLQHQAAVGDALGWEYVISQDSSKEMAGAVYDLLRSKGLTLAAAESCSGGRIADNLVAVQNVSQVFLGSVVCYHNRFKELFLGVPPSLLQQHGAVSAEVALAMAEAMRQRTSADFAVAVTGIAGPDGGTEEKPVGTVWFAVASAQQTRAIVHSLPWGREMIRQYSATRALDLVRRVVCNLKLEI